MHRKARRLALRLLGWSIRRALLALCVLHGATAAADQIVSAVYGGPTTRYPHGVLGDVVEHTVLVLGTSTGKIVRLELPRHLVFEDIAPRLVDLDLDGRPEVIVVESSQTLGARLAVYGVSGRVAATPYIGTRFRWLAPVGAADLDGDGHVEVAYIDRPHLRRTLRIWRFEAGALKPVADLPGMTNHRIAERDIAGGIRVCAGKPEMIVASANWSALVAVSFENGTFRQRHLGSDTDRAAFGRAMVCAL